MAAATDRAGSKLANEDDLGHLRDRDGVPRSVQPRSWLGCLLPTSLAHPQTRIANG